MKRQRGIVSIVGINDTATGVKKENQKAYSMWRDILKRCYDISHISYETYGAKGITVYEGWHKFSNFLRWYNTHNIEGYQIDKDLLSYGSKEYGPNTCCFLPNDINMALQRRRVNSNNYVGVTKKNGKYAAQMNYKGRKVYLGTYNNEKVAAYNYECAKRDFIAELAEQYRYDICEEAYNRMIELSEDNSHELLLEPEKKSINMKSIFNSLLKEI